MSKVLNRSGLTEQEVTASIAFADAAQELAGGRADESSRELSREVLRGNLSRAEAVSIFLDRAKQPTA